MIKYFKTTNRIVLWTVGGKNYIYTVHYCSIWAGKWRGTNL